MSNFSDSILGEDFFFFLCPRADGTKNDLIFTCLTHSNFHVLPFCSALSVQHTSLIEMTTFLSALAPSFGIFARSRKCANLCRLAPIGELGGKPLS